MLPNLDENIYVNGCQSMKMTQLVLELNQKVEKKTVNEEEIV